MKNIFLLPVSQKNQLSKLAKIYDFTNPKLEECNFKLELRKDGVFGINSYIKPHNIYITSDEEIKSNTWVLNIVNGSIYKTYSGNNFKTDSETEKWRKIILTTDQDLIEDGVQAIDNEFLEWFVKNPSCEFVNVKLKWHESKYNTNLGYTTYEIIILKEEPKQETLEEAAMNYLDRTYNLSYERTTWQKLHEKTFIAGAKWQQEQNKNLYNDEVVKQAFEAGHDSARLRGSYKSNGTFEEDFYEWFKQFKKK